MEKWKRKNKYELMLKKRKSPLHALFPEREAIRITPINKNKMETIKLIPVSGLPLEKEVKIDGYSYIYKGQHTVKKAGIKKSMYIFKGLNIEFDREFPVTQPPTFKMVNGLLIKN
ncbi:hypothetical protein [Chryseobacterium daeguense]|uniref:hypothetical protein n=1 Tax=Chryseobacterium daeguense TaxID=412438 RepID=UPI0012DE3EEB|nr:hypothetical protein [Chryseobacterium daeguense]